MSNREKLQQFIDEQKEKGVHFYEIEDNEYSFYAKINGGETISRDLLNMFKKHDYMQDVILYVDVQGIIRAMITNDEY